MISIIGIVKKRTLNCDDRATTLLLKYLYYLRKSSLNNHSANAVRTEIAKVCSNLKVIAKNSNAEPIQLVQNFNAGTSQEIAPCLPSRDALRQIVKRVREDLLRESDNLNNIVVPAQLTTTIMEIISFKISEWTMNAFYFLSPM
jgi:hypothetical protein